MALDETNPAPAEPSPLDTDEIPVVVVEKRKRPALPGNASLGSVALVLAVLQALGGLGLLFFYRPLVASAHLDLVDLVEVSRFGYVRELHRWGSHALVIAVALHLLRSVVMGTYRAPRRFNFQVGVALGVLVLLLAVTGYVLPWDVYAQWLLRGLDHDTVFPGDTAYPGDATLTAVFALHCGVLPVVAALAIVYHLRRARRDAAREAAESETGDGD